MSKGSKQRPRDIDDRQFANNWDRIFKKPDPCYPEHEVTQAEDEAWTEMQKRNVKDNENT